MFNIWLNPQFPKKITYKFLSVENDKLTLTMCYIFVNVWFKVKKNVSPATILSAIKYL